MDRKCVIPANTNLYRQKPVVNSRYKFFQKNQPMPGFVVEEELLNGVKYKKILTGEGCFWVRAAYLGNGRI